MIYYLNSELNAMVDDSIDKSKIRDESQFYRLHEAKRQKLLRNYDFINFEIPKEYIQLTEQQKDSILEFAKVFCLESSDFERYLSFVCHVGYCCEKADLNNSPEYKAILANYQFLKQLWRERYPTEYSTFEAEKLHTAKQQTQQARPNCPECKSDNVISKGEIWRCRTCGRSWLKHPRFKKTS